MTRKKPGTPAPTRRKATKIEACATCGHSWFSHPARGQCQFYMENAYSGCACPQFRAAKPPEPPIPASGISEFFARPSIGADEVAFPRDLLDRTIASMAKLIDLVLCECDHKRQSCEDIGCIGAEAKAQRSVLTSLRKLKETR